jgi:hypothetical protein
MCRHGLTRPNGANFFGGIVTNSEDKIEPGRAWFCKFVPTFTAGVDLRHTSNFQLPDGSRSNHARRLASGTEGCKHRPAFEVQKRFRHDGTRGITGAKKQDVIVRWHIVSSLTAS